MIHGKEEKPMGKNVLIAPIGTESQTVLITLDLLKHQEMKIDEVIVLHCSGNSRQDDLMEELIRAFKNDPCLRFEVKPIVKGKRSVSSLNTAKELEILFLCLYDEVRKQKRNKAKVHLLCSGGRKIIASYAMLAAELLFDGNDKLWFLLSGKGKGSNQEDPGKEKLYALHFLPLRELLPSAEALLEIENPRKALEIVESLKVRKRYDEAMLFIETRCTNAEKRVLECVAGEGLTNAQIAEKLVLSERTIESHLRSLLRKAEIYWSSEDISRTQLAVLVQPYYQIRFE